MLLMLLVVGPILWRQSLLWRVPDIGDPFPVADVLKPIPAETNAYPLFEEAYALRVPVPEDEFEAYWEQESDGWDPDDDLLNKYLDLNRPALEKWREATERPDCQIVPAGPAVDDSTLSHAQGARDLVRWCLLWIDRLTRSGRPPSQALPWFRAAFRASALTTRNATWSNRLTGIALSAISVVPANRWTQHPDVTEDELLELLSIVRESLQLTAPPSLTLKADYVHAQRYDRDWSLEAWLQAEPEFTRRLAAHVTANHLRFVDAPRHQRPPLLNGDLFDAPPADDEPSRLLPPRKLPGLLTMSRLTGPGDLVPIEVFDREKTRYACLQVAIAAQAHYRRYGRFPGELTELRPEYLPELPEDPFSEQPATVIYRVTGDDAVVYSRFKNGADDGGVVVDFDEPGVSLLTSDCGFVFPVVRIEPHRLSRRRTPAASLPHRFRRHTIARTACRWVQMRMSFSPPVSIEIPEPLARLTDEAREVQVEADTGENALQALWQRFPKLQSRVLDRHGRLYPYLLLLHNGRTVTHGELATRPLQPGDRLEIVALAEGG